MNLSAESIARAIVAALNGRRSGVGWVVKCPCHDDKHPSLRIDVRDGKVLVHCWGGCDQGVVVDELKRRGLWGDGVNGHAYGGHARASATGPREIKDPMRSWLSASPFQGNSPIDIYLKHRGIELTDDEARSLRFLPALWHWPSSTRWPCMLARVALAPDGGRDGTDLTTHQTFVDLDGGGKAPLEKPRLFVKGPTAGGGVWFGEASPDREFVVAEGIESLLSALRLEGVTAGCAALSEGGIRNLILPPAARRVLVWADHDELHQSIGAANTAARRWRAEGRLVKARMAAEAGEDANDVLQKRKQG